MAGHGAGVTEAEVDVIAIVDVGEMCAFGRFDEYGEGAGPFLHPVHRDATEQRILCRPIKRRGPRMVHHETVLFTVTEVFQFLAIEGCCGQDVALVSAPQKRRQDRRTPKLAEGVDYFAGGVGAGGAGEAVAGMSRGAAEEEVADRRFVAGPVEDGAHGEELVEGEFAVKDVAAGEAVGGFEILRRDDLYGFDQAGKIWGVRRERFYYSLAEWPAAVVAISFFQFEWG